VTLGRADGQGDLFDEVSQFCEESLPENSIYRFLARERDRLFPDELFADLFSERGRRSVPPSVVATVPGADRAATRHSRLRLPRSRGQPDLHPG
jgi:hypothetical protein